MPPRCYSRCGYFWRFGARARCARQTSSDIPNRAAHMTAEITNAMQPIGSVSTSARYADATHTTDVKMTIGILLSVAGKECRPGDAAGELHLNRPAAIAIREGTRRRWMGMGACRYLLAGTLATGARLATGRRPGPRVSPPVGKLGIGARVSVLVRNEVSPALSRHRSRTAGHLSESRGSRSPTGNPYCDGKRGVRAPEAGCLRGSAQVQTWAGVA